ncbi:MAG: hypothetical protein V7L00_28375, partial [Nostoc sp.]|uniref:hypothetical protein n=1 Tax=Nostoc sp. TaxID=1180 RepID=UPI002FFBA82D
NLLSKILALNLTITIGLAYRSLWFNYLKIAVKAINGGSKQRNERKLADTDKSIRPHCKGEQRDFVRC